MIELVILACHFASSGPQTCREYDVPLPDATHLQCVVWQQAELARWASEHPGLAIKRFWCASSQGKA